jgi:hypothetical protein
MKNFFELLATRPDRYINIEISVALRELQTVLITVNGCSVLNYWSDTGTIWQGRVPLTEPMDITVAHQSAYVDSLLIDGWQARPQWGTEHPGLWQFSTQGQPFYQWQHRVTGQGWLLIPQL